MIAKDQIQIYFEASHKVIPLIGYTEIKFEKLLYLHLSVLSKIYLQLQFPIFSHFLLSGHFTDLLNEYFTYLLKEHQVL